MERKNGENVMEEGSGLRDGGGGPLALAYKPQSKELFHTRPNTCCHWQMYKCVNTPEAYRERQTSLGIVLCKLYPLWRKSVCVWMKTAFILMYTYEGA